MSTRENQIVKSELLMPAGSLERLKVAVLYGADAVYLGTPDMSLRTKSKFSLDDITEGIAFAHANGVRVYLTLNLFTHNKDIAKLPDYVSTLRDISPDGIIVADPGVFRFLKTELPEISLHVSTQANVCSWITVDFWKEMGADLVVLAREVTFSELAEIREHCPDVRLESFIHGAMCMTYSGRCLLSNFMAERGANQGNCANSCRWQYKVHMRLKDGTTKALELTEENMELFEFVLEEGCRPGELMPIEEDMRGSYILNSKDMCLMPRLNDLLRIGVDSLKVEGRNKSAYYVATVARAYRRAIDAYYRDPDQWTAEPYMRELEAAGNRGYTIGFHEGRLKNYAHNYDNTKTTAPWEFAGIVNETREDGLVVEVKNRLEAGDVLEFLPPAPEIEPVLLRLYEFQLDGFEGTSLLTAEGARKHRIFIPYSAFDRENPELVRKNFPPYSVVRKETMLSEEEWQRLKLDRLARRVELNDTTSDRAYYRQRDRLQEAISAETMDKRARTSRRGIEGCCGRGCNGCVIFWNDPVYARARQILASKKHGEMLDSNMREPANRS
ncbi:peptidase U32 family protein [Martelella mediterranea]|uniref:Putative protease n=1 Tax=Martelella mediterranea TaxID=293089 RepID=A0A4R3NJ21_9HYPH|nr:U32 family peptidase [Martelella mediterranea]TCT27730.1 putative protease [Martelella mediterranea]